MWFFKRKKEKNKEEINLNINVLEDNFDFEEEQQAEIKENLQISEEQLIEEILTDFNIVLTKNNKMLREFYICKIFSRVGLKDLEFNLQIISIDKNVNRIKKDCFNLSRIIDNIKVGLKLDIDKLIEELTNKKAMEENKC